MKKLCFFLLTGMLMFTCNRKASDTTQTAPDVPGQPSEMPAQGSDDDVWSLKAYGDKDALSNLPSDIEITMKMDLAEDRVAGKAGCNNYFGSLKPSDEGYRISGIGSTKMMCPNNEVMQMEDAFLKMLSQVTGYSFRSGQMIMEVDGNRQLVFER